MGSGRFLYIAFNRRGEKMKNIEVYGTGESCPWCVKACDWLDAADEDYTYYNVREEAEAMQFLQNQGFKSVPQIFVDGVHIGGYTDMIKVL